jgi:cell division protein FtsI/penicillin-binding protein 2
LRFLIKIIVYYSFILLFLYIIMQKKSKTNSKQAGNKQSNKNGNTNTNTKEQIPINQIIFDSYKETYNENNEKNNVTFKQYLMNEKEMLIKEHNIIQLNKLHYDDFDVMYNDTTYDDSCYTLFEGYIVDLLDVLIKMDLPM